MTGLREARAWLFLAFPAKTSATAPKSAAGVAPATAWTSVIRDE